ncbi:alpha- and gamma-adaptin-binding protein p34-like isoform X2 [Athalia rosae]|uniref:alpha- and gamma-adaptin-binding protein p34-like isoform X2 n=1 Tax=Athalia rosae TaxID=37344 RepID=UPI002033B6E1|nr:alpha- and gamma-adaptin-binding protein p34-like isoform X2 [Athalia rosae]
MNLPRVLIASTVSGKADDIAKEIGCKDLLSKDDVIKYYVWDIENKYYKAQVLLCTTDNPLIKIDCEGVEGLVIYFDGRLDRRTNSLDEWVPLISSLSEAEVQILAWDSAVPSANVEDLQDWCTQYKFELVDLSHTDSTENPDDSDEENEKHGINRIVEALHAHTWPNMDLKGDTTMPENVCTDITDVDEQLQGVHLNPIHNVSQSLQLEHMLEGIMGGENADFGELFGQLLAMKEHAASLPANQRRAAAEQLVTAFWKAMGGDSEEIDGVEHNHSWKTTSTIFWYHVTIVRKKV